MAGGAKDGKDEAEPASPQPETSTSDAGDGELEFVDWDYRLLSLERIQADGEEDEDANYFTAKFQVDGPNATRRSKLSCRTSPTRHT